MTSFDPTPTSLRSLKDKVVVLTGGANGIGAATVDLLIERGAQVVFGDLDATSGEKVATKHDSDRVKFIPTDVTKYEDHVALFKLALEKFGRVDHALSIAGIVEQGKIFDPGLSVEDVEKPPNNVVLNVNLIGTLYFARVAVPYLKHNKLPADDKSIVLISSAAGFCDSPGLFAYGASKHGVLGLMRCLRHYLALSSGIRINAVTPLATATTMVPQALQTGFQSIGLIINTPRQVAEVTLALAAGSHKGKNGEHTAQIGLGPEGGPCNGLTVYVEGGKAFEIEEGLAATRDEWLGRQQNENLMKAGQWLASGTVWTSEQ